jgi:hypothetical protein
MKNVNSSYFLMASLHLDLTEIFVGPFRTFRTCATIHLAPQARNPRLSTRPKLRQFPGATLPPNARPDPPLGQRKHSGYRAFILEVFWAMRHQSEDRHLSGLRVYQDFGCPARSPAQATPPWRQMLCTLLLHRTRRDA